MNHQIKGGKSVNYRIKEKDVSARLVLVALVISITMTFWLAGESHAVLEQKTFSSPEEAVKTAVTAARNNDDKNLMSIFGPSAKDLIFSGDAVADRQRREQFLKSYDEKNSIVAGKDGMVLVIGENDWPFPIPLVKKGEVWFFDTVKGREEILNRRIGENELSTIQTVLAIVDAQREYAMTDRDGDGMTEYAEKFASDPGKKNGLYWETKEGEEPSPLGQLLAKAKSEGYSKKGSKGNPVPYHGYYYRILKAQGKNVSGGAYSYVVKGSMLGGFAVVAWPAKYGNSGVMTFIVNHDGIVYQKDLGPKTELIAKKLKVFDPDTSWKKAE